MRSLRTRSGSIGAVCVEPARSDVAYVFDEEIVRGYGQISVDRGLHLKEPTRSPLYRRRVPFRQAHQDFGGNGRV